MIQNITLLHDILIFLPATSLNKGKNETTSSNEKINANNGLSIIGYVTGKNEGQHIITRGGNKHALVAQGWNHLNK